MNYLNPGCNLDKLRDSLYKTMDRLKEELKKPNLTKKERDLIHDQLASIEARLP